MKEKIIEIVWEYSNSEMAFEIADKLHALRYEVAKRVLDKFIGEYGNDLDCSDIGMLYDWLNESEVE